MLWTIEQKSITDWKVPWGNFFAVICAIEICDCQFEAEPAVEYRYVVFCWQTEGVYNQRLQNLAITLDKVRHILTTNYNNPSLAPPPLRKLDKREMVQWIWKKENSVVNELLQCMTPHLPKEGMADLKQSMAKHVPNDMGTNLMECLLWYVHNTSPYF